MPNSNDPFQAFLNGTSPSTVSGATWAATDAVMIKKRAFKRLATEDMPSKPLPAKAGFTFGCDPEGFLFKDGKPISAAGLIPGTKEEPHPVEGGAIQVDGMAAEFNIDPVSTFEDFDKNIVRVIEQLKGFLPSGVTLEFVPSVRFDEKDFDAAPDHAKSLGCQPDFDAWTGGVNPPPCPEDQYVRCAGGHLHYGWTKGEDLCSLQHLLNCQDLVKQLDWYLGGWSVYKDTDSIRRSIYGKMGSCRYKDYGVEYRVLSNFWVATPETRLEVWNRMNHAISTMSSLYFPDRVPANFTEMLRNQINTSTPDDELIKTCRYPLETLNVARCSW